MQNSHQLRKRAYTLVFEVGGGWWWVEVEENNHQQRKQAHLLVFEVGSWWWCRVVVVVTGGWWWCQTEGCGVKQEAVVLTEGGGGQKAPPSHVRAREG